MSADLSPKQLQFMRESNARVNILEGSIRSGKTIVSLLRWLMFVAQAPYGGELVMVGRTRDSLYRNVIRPLQDPSLFGDLAGHVVYTNGAPTARILGRPVHIIGASDAKSEKIVRGMTVAGSYADEVTVLPADFFITLLGRMSVRGAQLFGTTNPDNPAHWLKRRFLDRIKDLPGWRTWHFTIEDNPSLSEDYKRSIRSEYTGLWYRRFILGEWVAAEGAVYSMWDPDIHVATPPPLERLVGVGIDYGTTNATAAVLLGIGDGKLWAAGEWRHDPANANVRLTDSELSARFRAWKDTLPEDPEWICVDPSAASFKLQLHGDGVSSVVDADNDVSYGIRTVASLLGTQQLMVSPECPELIAEVPGYSWDDKYTLKGEDKPIKVADHSLDALRYAVATTESLWRGYVDQYARAVRT